MFVLFYSSPWGGERFPFTTGVMIVTNCLVFLVFLGSPAQEQLSLFEKGIFLLQDVSAISNPVINFSNYPGRGWLPTRLWLCICPVGDSQTDACVKATMVALWGHLGWWHADSINPNLGVGLGTYHLCQPRPSVLTPPYQPRRQGQTKIPFSWYWHTLRLSAEGSSPTRDENQINPGTLAHVGPDWGCLHADNDYLCVSMCLCWGKDALSADNWVKSNRLPKTST